MPGTAKLTPTRRAGTGRARSGGEFFGRPTGPNHRRYEALRGYLYEGLTIEAAAARSGYSVATLRSLVRDFRAGKTGFFLNPRPGPTRAPAKNAAREQILALRRAGHLLTVVDPADDGFVEDADRYRRFGRQADGLVGDVTVVRQARPRVSSAW